MNELKLNKLIKGAHICSIIAAVVMCLGLKDTFPAVNAGAQNTGSYGFLQTMIMYGIPGLCYFFAFLLCVMQAELLRRRSFGIKESLIRTWLSTLFIVLSMVMGTLFLLMMLPGLLEDDLTTMLFKDIPLVYHYYGVGCIQVIALPFLAAERVFLRMIRSEYKKAAKAEAAMAKAAESSDTAESSVTADSSTTKEPVEEDADKAPADNTDAVEAEANK